MVKTEVPSLETPQASLEQFHREAKWDSVGTGRYALRYFRWGSGPPLIFIHGVSDVGKSFVFLASQLCQSFQCIGYNLPLGNEDGARLGSYRHEHLVHDLIALMDHLQLDEATVLGSSFGSTVALKALKNHPNRIKRGILQGGLAHRPLRAMERFACRVLRYMPGPTARLPRREKILTAVHRPPFAGRSEEYWKAFVEFTGESRLSAMGYQGGWLHQVDLRPDLAHIHQPVLLIAGDRDSVVPYYHAEMLKAGLPRSELAVIRGAGHVPLYTHPGEMAHAIRTFLGSPA